MLTVCLTVIFKNQTHSQACTPLGNQTTFGTGNTWIGYVYNHLGFLGYMGYINVGSSADPSFETDFGGPYGMIPTNGCSVDAESFSVRFKLEKAFTPGYYELIAAGDDRVRLSIDGGSTWLINNWVFNDFNSSTATVFLSGTYQLVLEYEEGAHNNKVYFSVQEQCVPAIADLNEYGTSNQWRGYLYSGSTFSNYKGWVVEGSPTSLNFTQSFGGANTLYSTSDCQVQTDFFSTRYRLRQNFPFGSYTFTVSGDDKYRFSIDGGSNWVIDRWNYNTGNTSRTYTTNLNGVYDLVLEYYEKDGSNSIGISRSTNLVLASHLINFSGARDASGAVIKWSVDNDNTSYFDLERSGDGVNFISVKNIPFYRQTFNYSFKDLIAASGEPLYYRLKVVSSAGEISYSRTISLHSQIKGIKFFPTFDVGQSLSLSNESILSNAQVILKDLFGRDIERIKLNSLSAGQTTQISFRHFFQLHGWYLLELISDGSIIKTQKIYFK